MRSGSQESHISTNLKLYNTYITHFLCSSKWWAFTKRDLYKIDALDQWCLRKLFCLECNVRRRTSKQPQLSAIVQARCFSLFGHIAWIPDETDAKEILTASPLENWTRPPHQDALVLRGWRLSSKTWNTISSLNEAIVVAQNCPLWILMSTFGATHRSSGAIVICVVSNVFAVNH